MPDQVLVFYGSYRRDRMGVRLADFIVAGLSARGAQAELIDAREVGLPMLDRMYKEYPPGSGRRRWKRSRGRSRPPTPSFSSPANTIGACSRG